MKWALVLSGGGTRGAAHIGVLKALEEHHLQPDLLVGVSAGSIVAGLYSLGYTANDLLAFMGKVDQSMFNLNWWGIMSSLGKWVLRMNKPFSHLDGLIKATRFERYIEGIIQAKLPEGNMTDIKMPLLLTALDINQDEQVVFTNHVHNSLPKAMTNVKLAEAIRASMAVPVLFTPKTIAGRLLVDGAIYNDVPVDLAHQFGITTVVAVDLGYTILKTQVTNLAGIGGKALTILLEEAIDRPKNQATVRISPDLSQYPSSDLVDTATVYQIGYSETIKHIPEIQRALTSSSPKTL